MTLAEEDHIITCCQNGDLTSFASLYDHYFQKIYQFIYFKTLDRTTTEDLCSQTFLTALEKISQYQTKKGKFSAWIFTLARNKVIDHFRKIRPQLGIDDCWELTDPTQNPEQALEEQEKIKQAQKILQELPLEKRELLIMRLWQELSYQEIAEITGKSPASLKMSFSRLIRNLSQSELILISLTIKTLLEL